MTATPSGIIARALRAANTNRVANTCATIADLYCDLLCDGSRSDRYISLSHSATGNYDGTGAYCTDEATAVHVGICDGIPPFESDTDDMIEASFGLLADLLAEQGGNLCLRDGTDLRPATPEEIAASWIEGGSGMIETEHDGALVAAYVEGA